MSQSLVVRTGAWTFPLKLEDLIKESVLTTILKPPKEKPSLMASFLGFHLYQTFDILGQGEKKKRLSLICWSCCWSIQSSPPVLH